MRQGLLAEFDEVEAVTGAIARLRQAGYTRLEAWSPFPVLAIETALELPRSRLPGATLAAGLAGASLAYLVQWYLTAVDYPLDVGGRPLHSAPAFVPITFEVAILLAGLATVLGLLVACGLPRLWRPVFEVEGFERAQADRFFLGIDATDPRFDQDHGRTELLSAGALRVVRLGALLGLALLTGCDADHDLQRMTRQRRAEAYRASGFFADGKTMREPPPGAVARGAPAARPGKRATRVPIELDHARLERGRELFEVVCAACHGLEGDGRSAVADRMTLRRPPSLVGERMRAVPVGRLYEVATSGHGLMPAVLAPYTVEERWEVVAYLRALQLSREARLDELPGPLRDEARRALEKERP